MEALRIVKTVRDNTLPELEQYKGQNVEIIILPGEGSRGGNNGRTGLINELRGSCPNLRDGMEYQEELRKEWDR